jgi:hypothetical protein
MVNIEPLNHQTKEYRFMGASQSRPATTPINGEATRIECADDAQAVEDDSNANPSANTGSAVGAAPSSQAPSFFAKLTSLFRHPASVPPPGERTSEGSFGGMPSEIAYLIAEKDNRIPNLMMQVSKGTRALFRDAGKDDIQIAYLRKLLRKENPEIPEALRQYFYSDSSVDDAAAASTANDTFSFTPAVKETLTNTKALFTAYQAYFEHYLAMYMPYEDSGYKTWPTESMDELGRLFASLKEIEAALPVKLIQGTGLGVLQATAQYLNSFASMANNNNKFNWDELDRLAVQGLGGAQKAAGDSIVDLYFCGDSMSDPSSRDSYGWAEDLNSKLGSNYFLLIFNGTAIAERGLRGLLRWRAPSIDRNSLSLIEVLTASLDYSLRREVSADESDPAPKSP